MYSNAILKLVPCKNKAVCATWRVLKHVFCCAELLYPTDWMLTYLTFFSGWLFRTQFLTHVQHHLFPKI